MKSIEQSISDLDKSVQDLIERIGNEENEDIKSCFESMLKVYLSIAESWQDLIKWEEQMKKWIRNNK